MKKDYKQYYTSSLFNIKNNIDFLKKTLFINIFTNNDLKVFNEINDKIVIYNSELHFFNYLDIVNKVIQSDIPIYSDNIKIRMYLYENGAKPKFIEKKYIQVDKNIDLSLFNMFKISSDEKYPLVIKYEGNNEIIMERLIKKLPTIVVDKINIYEIEEAVINNRLLYVENIDYFIKNITSNFYISNKLLEYYELFKMNYYKNDYKNGVCIFFGIYSENDIQTLINHNGYKFLIWGGNYCNLNYIEQFNYFDIINKIPDLYHITISNDIQEKLIVKNVESIYCDLNLENNEFNINYYFNKVYILDCFSDKKFFLNKNNNIVNNYKYFTNINEIINDAVINNYEQICILNDNIILHDNFNNIFTYIINSTTCNWEILCLGCNFLLPEQEIIDNILKLDEKNIFKGGCCLKKNIINKLKMEHKISNLSYFSKFYNDNFYCIYPSLIKNNNNIAYFINNNSHLFDSITITIFQLYISQNINFNNFDIISYNNLNEIKNYELIIIDMFSIYRSNKYTKNIIESILYKLKSKCNKLGIFFRDLHNRTFNFYNILNNDDNYSNLDIFLKEYKIDFGISIYNNFELDIIKNKTKLNIYHLPLIPMIEPVSNIIHNKDIDILFYGCKINIYYPLRDKIYNILNTHYKKKSNLNIIILDEYNNYKCDTNYTYNLIKRSKYCISCNSIYDYNVLKNFEIVFNDSIIIGKISTDINYMFNSYISDNKFYIELNENMTDSTIINIIDNSLINYNNIYKSLREPYNNINNIFNINNFSNNLSKICKNILNDSNNNTIKQIYIAQHLIPVFNEKFMNSYNLEKYNDIYSPTFFYGCLRNIDYINLFNHKSYVILIWTGGDINLKYREKILNNTKLRKNLEKIKESKNIINIAISDSIENNMKLLNMNYKRINFIYDLQNIKQLDKKGDKILIYSSITEHEVYGSVIYNKLFNHYGRSNFLLICNKYEYINKKKIDNNNFKYFEDINDAFKQSFIILRLTDFDGLGGVTVEGGFAGLYSVHNNSISCCLKYNNINDIINHIDEQKNKSIDLMLVSKMKKEFNLNPEIYKIKYYFNK